MTEGLTSELASTIPKPQEKDPHLGGRDVRPEESGTEALKIKHEQERQKDREFLGMYDLGYDSDKLAGLEQQIDSTNKELNDYRNKVYEERKALEAELRPAHTLPLRSDSLRGQRPARMARGERPQVDSDFLQKESRLNQLSWGFRDKHEVELRDALDRIQREAYIEKDKRPDSVDLDEVVEELNNAGLLPEAKYGKNASRTVLMKVENEPFRGQVESIEFIQRDVDRISNRTHSEVWFHTTKPKHLDRMIQNGGMATTSWLSKNDQGYHRTLVENSVAQGSSKDLSYSSPLNQSDTDKIYFRANSLEFYGDAIIAYAPEDLMLDTGLFFYADGWQHMDERVVSDVVDATHDRLPQNGSSNLQISFDRAYIAVHKSDYREKSRQLLLAGYSKQWIEEHVFSYRGDGKSRYVGQKAAAEEIKRRLESSRKEKGVIGVHALPNPASRWAKVYQLSSEQTVQFVDKQSNNAEAVQETEKPLQLSFTRTDLDTVLNNPTHTPQDILNLLDKDFGGILDSQVGVWEGYKLREHTIMMMNQHQKYFADKPLPRGVDSKLIEVIYSFHDMGKPKAVSEYRKDKQHEYTVDILNEVMPQLEYGEGEIALATSLVKGEAIGKYLISGNLQDSVDQIKKAQIESGLPPKDFWELLKIYYMCDASSYTADAGGKKSLDHLFVFDSEKGTIDFSDATKNKVLKLERAVLEA